MFKFLRAICAGLSVLSSAAVLSAGCVSSSSVSGCVKFAQRTDSGFDQFNENRQYDSWINSHFWRLQTSPGYFDGYLKYLPHAWAYIDSYAIYAGGDVAAKHPDWILQDQYGNPLYIPWGCSNGHCPQWAGDITNPNFKASIIAEAKSYIAAGYLGLWIDDVNLDMTIGDGYGNFVRPIDPATNAPMTDAAWRAYFAQFMTEIRQALPNVEITHNSVWFAGGGADPGKDPSVQKEIKAANYINREGGVQDGGLTGDNGFWSMQNLLRFFDQVHALGTHVILENFSNIGEYGPACYFLTADGIDAYSDMSANPTNWAAMYDVQLGDPMGARYDWNGLIRRDFAKGVVLVNPPGKATVKVTLPSGAVYRNIAGQIVTSVSLSGKQGAILTTSTAVAPPPPPSQPIANGIHVITNQLSGLVLDDPAGSVTSGQQMIQWSSNGGDNQKWKFTFDSTTNAYTIMNLQSGMYLADVSQKLVQRPLSAYPNQLWIASAANGGYVLKNRATGLVMDDPASSTAQGTGIITWSPNPGGTRNQTWIVN
jgi:hypothetical protein